MHRTIIPLLAALGLALGLGGCGGGKKSAAGAAAGAQTESWEGKRTSSGLPAWVDRGSAMVTGDGNRVFYGVGVASGIRNPALLRSTADNRARNEIAKVFETFSASLMKDYMNSTGDQNVEQAIKTFTSVSLEGVEIVDRYIAGDGGMYALAKMDLKKVMEGVRKAKELGMVKSYTEKVSVDDIFDAHSKKPEAPKRVVAEGSSAPAAAAPPKEATSSTRKSGVKPAWVEGPDPSYPERDYLCGVGFGPKREIAESGAHAALARIFTASVESVSKDFMGAYSSTGAQPIETQSSETLTQVSTEKVLSGVSIPEIWEDTGKSTIYAIACLDRHKAAASLREQIAESDREAGEYLQRSTKVDKAKRVSVLAKALQAIVHREVLNGELRIVAPDGIGITGPYSHADVAAAFEAAVAALRVGVVVEGPYDDDFRGAFVEGLTNRGYEVTEVDDDASGFDVVIKVTTRVEDAGKGSRPGIYYARGVISIEVQNGTTGKTFASFNESRKEGHGSKEEAERRAIRKLTGKIVQEVTGHIDAKMKGA